MKINKEARFSDLICYTKLYKKSSGYFHWHERIEICQIFSPGCSFFIDGETVQTEPGDLVVMGEYEVHKFIIENDDSRIRLCQFPLNILFGAGCKIKPIKKHIPKSEIDTIPGLYDSITSIFDLMEKEQRAAISEENPHFRSLSASLYFLLMRHFVPEEESSEPKKDRHEFYRIIDFINKNYTKDINVDTIAKTLCMSRGKLSAIFRKYTETDIITYVSSLRINYANQLFEDGKTITDAAFESGFQSIRTFNNTYKKLMGITPSQYLKK